MNVNFKSSIAWVDEICCVWHSKIMILELFKKIHMHILKLNILEIP
jgi:hypothetical protein